MARKRGGLAGLYDRNKGIIQKLAPAALSFVPGIGVPLAAAAGAAMRGLDRPGQRGIGLDVGQAIRGGLEGAAIGGGTQALAGGVKGLLTGAGKGIAAPNLGATQMTSPGLAGQTLASTAPAGMGAGAGAMQAAPSMLSRAGDIAKSGLSFARENKDLIGMAGKGLMAAMPDPGTEAAMMNAETGRMRFEQEKADAERERERSRRIAELLMPYLEQQGYLGSTR